LNTFALAHQVPGAAGVASPHSVFGVADQGADLLPSRLGAYMKRVRPDVLEVVCHPGALPGTGSGGDADGLLPPEYGPMRISGQWRAERDALAAPGWGEVFPRGPGQAGPLRPTRPRDPEAPAGSPDISISTQRKENHAGIRS